MKQMLKKSELTANMLLNVYIFISNKEQSGCVDLLIVCRKIRQYSHGGEKNANSQGNGLRGL